MKSSRRELLNYYYDYPFTGKKHKHKYEKLLKEGKLDSVVDSTKVIIINSTRYT